MTIGLEGPKPTALFCGFARFQAVNGPLKFIEGIVPAVNRLEANLTGYIYLIVSDEQGYGKAGRAGLDTRYCEIPGRPPLHSGERREFKGHLGTAFPSTPPS